MFQKFQNAVFSVKIQLYGKIVTLTRWKPFFWNLNKHHLTNIFLDQTGKLTVYHSKMRGYRVFSK